MRSHPTRPHWDGSPRAPHPHRWPPRALATSPDRLPHPGQARRCCACGNRIELYPGTGRHLVALHPAELTAAEVPEDCQWHLSAGIAYPSGDGSMWCRIPHRLVCPRRTPAPQAGVRLGALRHRLTLHTRRLIDAGLLTPAPRRSEQPPPTPARPVVRILLNLYLADTPVENIRCVAQPPHRPPCRQRVLDARCQPGVWRLLPTGPHHEQGPPSPPVAIYDLHRLDRDEQLRWRIQHCPEHATAPADLDQAEWQVLDPLLHAAHLHARLPRSSRRPCQGA
ncbi:DUF6083 domain-containing protein [Streptomyces flaveolus]|uniref:DUF6083 domain-containing protein n=1 Tax=Streptomyces flaveolus TaxID=67297 RepID=UPI00343217E1